jgi:hypothetical protein
MAQHAHARKLNLEQPQPPERAERAPPKLTVVPPVTTEIEPEPGRPVVGVHRGAIEIALAASVWFVAAMVVLFATNNALANLVLAVVAGFALMFFTVTLKLASKAARQERWADTVRTTLSDFVHDNVALETGLIGGREALIEITMLPITLAIGATIIGIIFRAGW